MRIPGKCQTLPTEAGATITIKVKKEDANEDMLRLLHCATVDVGLPEAQETTTDAPETVEGCLGKISTLAALAQRLDKLADERESEQLDIEAGCPGLELEPTKYYCIYADDNALTIYMNESDIAMMGIHTAYGDWCKDCAINNHEEGA